MKPILFWIQFFLIVSGVIIVSGKCRDNVKYCRELYEQVYKQNKNSTSDNALLEFLSNINSNRQTSKIRTFFCLVNHPPCGESLKQLENSNELLRIPKHKEKIPKPCRESCKRTWKLWRKTSLHLQKDSAAVWPLNLRCADFNNQNCIHIRGRGTLVYIGYRKHHRKRKVDSVPVIPEDDNVVEVVSFDKSQMDILKYNADPYYFHGWADVQGKGHHNDYCRVIGKGHRKFLACALDGVESKVHHYVSTLGFEPGTLGSWYMRDEDNDGRDDYCRCVESKDTSHIMCMKAGDKGFYGGPFMGGSQFTFTLPGSEGCLVQ